MKEKEVTIMLEEPNEPHDHWGRTLQKKESMFVKLRDIFVFTFTGIIFVFVLILFYSIYLPFYVGREVCHRLEKLYINK